jgi:acyl dehydratase
MAEKLYFEDMPVGQRFVSGILTVEKDHVLAFAAQFDPQPFHTDEAAARDTLFQRLAASGWHTAAMTMRLIVETLPVAGGVIGAGLDGLRWPKPVYPGDTLQVEIEVTEARLSRSNPSAGWVKLQITTRNQAGDVVQVAIPNIMATKRETETA